MSEYDPDFIFLGPGRTASTWLYECLVDHPEVLMTDRKVVNYYDRKYHKGQEWFESHYPSSPDGRKVGNVATSYVSMPGVPERIVDHVNDVTLLMCLRNPVERAYSHWWHIKQSGFDYEFEDAFDVDTPYIAYLLPGMYHLHLSRYQRYFDDEQIELLFFEDLVDDDVAYLSEIFDRIGVDPDYVPAQAKETINEADGERPAFVQQVANWVGENASENVKSKVRPIWERTVALVEDTDEYDAGMSPEVREECERIYAADVRKLQNYVNRDLGHWFKHVDL